MSINYLSVCLLLLCTNSLNYWTLRVSGEETFLFCFKLEGHRGVRTCDFQLSNAPGPALYMYGVLHMLTIYSVIGYHKQNKCNEKHL